MISATCTSAFGNGFCKAEIEPNLYIRLHGHSNNHVFDITFVVGEQAEYDSYNLRYTGPILAIGPKTVTIDAKLTGCGIRRLKLAEFAWRNYDFNAAKIAADNADTMQCI